MSRTAHLRRQHDAAVVLVEQIAARLDGPAPCETEAFALGMTLAKLTGLLRIHFAQEDKVLYPYLAAAEDATTAQTAAAFQDEMGGLSATYAAFAERWTAGRTIAADFAGFATEARAVFAALGDRIARENHVLYPLADGLSPALVRGAA